MTPSRGGPAATLGVPCFLYGEERSLPQVRKEAWRTLAPDTGPREPHPTAGAMCVGARPPLVAYNVWLVEPDLALARRIAAAVRGPHLRALGLAVGRRVQVSMNLIAPGVLGPAAAYDLVAAQAPVAGAELVGLVPQDVLLADRARALGRARPRPGPDHRGPPGPALGRRTGRRSTSRPAAGVSGGLRGM